MCHRVSVRIAVLVVFLLGAASAARAQAYIVPFAGANFGGTAGCRSALNCEDRFSNVGVGVGTANVLFGFEEEFGYAKDFFGRDPLQSTSVVTLMSNFMVGPRIGIVRPYGVIGGGIVKTHTDLTVSALTSGDTSFGWNVGGGLEIAGRHLGVRGDVRYLHGVHDVTIPLLPVQSLTLDFGRATLGLVLRF